MKQKKALVTGSSGLTGGEMVKNLCSKGWKVYGIDANIRGYLFGPESSTLSVEQRLSNTYNDFVSTAIDIRDAEGIDAFFKKYGPFDYICHAAAQPSHQWSVDNLREDHVINSVGTVNILEAYRHYSPEAPFIYISSSKVAGDSVNDLPLVELETRYDLPITHKYYEGVDEEYCRIDRAGKSPFGNSKACGDLSAQEFAKYFNLPIAIFRPVCISGSLHKSAANHGFLAHIAKCVATGELYTINARLGKQLRDTIHAEDLCSAFYEFYRNPKKDAIYTIGAGRKSVCSIIEAIHDVEDILGKKANFEYGSEERLFDHLWCVYSANKFRADYSSWEVKYDRKLLMEEICSQYM